MSIPGPLRGIWIEEGDTPEYAKLRSLGVRRIGIDCREDGDENWGGWDPCARIADVRANGFIACAYWGANWGELNYTPESFALKIDAKIGRWETRWRNEKRSLQCEFMLDDEWHDPDWMLAWLRKWRLIRPTKQTQITTESFQGGSQTWFTRDLVNAINADPNLVMVVQLYWASVDHHAAGIASMKDLMWMVLPDGKPGGIDAGRIQGFYDAAELEEQWDGYLFTNRRLA